MTMSDDKTKTSADARRARQAEALRRNLMRRKEQARAKVVDEKAKDLSGAVGNGKAER
jgi:hypothetical protein